MHVRLTAMTAVRTEDFRGAFTDAEGKPLSNVVHRLYNEHRFPGQPANFNAADHAHAPHVPSVEKRQERRRLRDLGLVSQESRCHFGAEPPFGASPPPLPCALPGVTEAPAA